MDFCHPCRRHLNGALACPGCGTAVEELRAHAEEADVAPQSDIAAEPYGDEDSGSPDQHMHGPDDGSVPQGRAARRRAEGRRRGTGREADEQATGPAVGGSTSRRDRKAAAHRRRRRRTLLITAGFVLAAGGLSLAELGVDAPFADPGPPAAGGANAEGGTSSQAQRTARPARSLDGPTSTGTGSMSPNPSASASASDSPSPSASKSAGGKATRSATAGASPVTPTQGPATTRPAETGRPTADPTTSKPDPSPSQTCTRFLWWCT
ncbi:SCO2400 family protein [Streptomyces sp. NPDC003753]|uniref:SCO2400 family protein n=1 Tax=Streptomyces sp. Y2F8-2 TaxID=2759675 RepID=UPI001902CA9C|nr:hypothetical protein [Streptomyces sp. Y2F8-2]GHJ98666.1 hypothetical protein SY2F82_04640 [Streptomyces sp. Y2F8-2]